MDSQPECLSSDLQDIAAIIRASAQRRRDDGLALLALLRVLEQLHREIQDDLFQPTLPNNRQALYALLRDMEAQGGWPYIPRFKLRSLLTNLFEQPSEPMLVDEVVASEPSQVKLEE
ncbi:MAG: hypothetical protein F6K19_00390 [Cyanothece sp. SIO1E1]|nr:hypothetical protein [Cyanothece sp. SIO1E1]